MNTEILKLFLKLDYRSRTDSGYKRVFGILLSYLIANTLLSYNSYRVYDRESFMFVAYTINFFLIAFIVITDYHELLFAKTQSEALSILPFSGKDYFLPKLVSALIYIVSLPLLFALPQTVFAYAYGIGMLQTFVFFLTLVLYSLSSGIIIILLYSIAVYLTRGRAKWLILFIQFAFFILIFILAGYASGRGLEKQNLLNEGFAVYLPMYYFVLSNNSIIYFIVIIFSSALVFTALLMFMNRNYFALSEIISETDDFGKKGFRSAGYLPDLKNIEKIFLGNSLQSSAFYLAKNFFRNSASFRLRIFPLAVIPVAISLVSVFLGTPPIILEGGGGLSSDSILIISPSVTMVLIMTARLMIVNSKFSIEGSEDTEWIYDSLPVESRSEFLKGVNRFFYMYLLVPVVIILLIIIGFKVSLADTLLNLLYTASFIWFMNSVWIRFDKKYPFTVESSRISSASRYINVVFLMIIGIAFFVSQFLLFENIIFVIISIIIFFLLPAAVKLKHK